MATSEKGLFTVLAGAALAISIAACGSSASTGGAPKKPADPLAGLSGDQLVAKALVDGRAASGLRISGTMSDSGSAFTMDISLVRGKGCTGSMAVKGKGSFKLIYIGTTFWMKPDKAFYESAGVSNALALSILSGKYLKISRDSGLKNFATFCDLSTFLGGFRNPSGLPMPIRTTLDGQPALEIKDTTDNAAGYISDTPTPELIELTAPSGGGSLTLSDYGVPVTLAPPPASQVLNGSRYGF